jgi:hypothetical protein
MMNISTHAAEIVQCELTYKFISAYNGESTEATQPTTYRDLYHNILDILTLSHFTLSRHNLVLQLMG